MKRLTKANRHTVRAGDTWHSLAETSYGDRGLAPDLRMFNGWKVFYLRPERIVLLPKYLRVPPWIAKNHNPMAAVRAYIHKAMKGNSDD